MAQTYMNPFAGSILPETVQNNPFASRMNQLDNREMMAPFVQMEQQRQQADLQKTQVENAEFMSEPAAANRLQTINTKTAQQRLAAQQADADFEQLPLKKKIELAEMNAKLRGIEGGPAKSWVDFVSNMVPALENLSPQEQAAKFQGMMTMFAAQYPGANLPPELTQYSPELFGHMKDLRRAKELTPEHVRKIAEDAAKDKAHMERTQAEVAGRAANTAATTGSNERIHTLDRQSREKIANEAAAKANVTPGKFKSQQMAILNNPKSTDEEIEIAENNLLPDAMQAFATHLKINEPYKAMAGGLINVSPEDPKVKRLEAYQNKLKNEFFADYGLKVKTQYTDGKIRYIDKSKLRGALKDYPGLKVIK